MNRRLVMGIILMCLAGVVPLVLAQGSSVVGGDDAALRAYIERFVNPTGLSQPFTVHIGALPESLPFELALPPGVTVAGSITRTDNEGKQAFEIALNGSTPAEVLTFYTQAFGANGWQIIQADDTTSGGFSTSAGTLGRFCLNGTVASVLVDSTSPEAGKNLVSIVIHAPAEVWECEAMLAPGGDDPYAVLAATSLGTPAGVTVVNNTGDGLSYYTSSSNTASKNAVIRSDLPVADIATGYNDQLAALGWTNVTTENGTGFAISTWTLTDVNGKAWKGTFMLTPSQNPGIYNALIYVED